MEKVEKKVECPLFLRSHVLKGLVTIVIAIVTTGVLLAIPTYFAMLKMRQVGCRANLESIGMACRRYAHQHGGRYPQDITELAPNFLDAKKLKCPAAIWAGKVQPHYHLEAGLRDNVSDRHVIMAYDAAPLKHAQAGRMVLFMDGTTEWWPLSMEDKFRMQLEKERTGRRDAADGPKPGVEDR